MKQPYTYSMPESFLKDKSVPARWRVLGVINGFILNGGCFYGSNEWLMEQLDCSEQTVSNAFAELERLGEIRTERTKRTRKVYKTSRDPKQLGSETQVGSTRDPSWFGSNSVSNSEKNIAVADAPAPIEIVSDDTDKPRRAEKKPTYPNARKIFPLFPDKDESWNINTTELRAGEILAKRGEDDVKKAIGYCIRHLNDDGFPIKSLTPYLLATNWKRIYDYARRNG